MEHETAHQKRFKGDEWPKWITDYGNMKKRQNQNFYNASVNKNENEVYRVLKTTGLKWWRQVQCGYRLFDFWNFYTGTAVEVDGSGHDLDKDSANDADMLRRCGIAVLRVKNGDADGLNNVVTILAGQESWKKRRESNHITIPTDIHLSEHDKRMLGKPTHGEMVRYLENSPRFVELLNLPQEEFLRIVERRFGGELWETDWIMTCVGIYYRTKIVKGCRDGSRNSDDVIAMINSNLLP